MKIKYPELLKQEYKARDSDRYKGFILIGSWTLMIIGLGLALLYG